MKTKKCKHCQGEVAKSAKRCPKCGGKLGIPSWAKFLIIVLIVLGCIVGCVNSCSNAFNDAVDETNNSYADINGKTSFKLNETFQNKYEKITMTQINTNFKQYSEYLKPSNGNKVVMLKFEVENINEDNDELYVSSMSFSAYADGVAVDSFYGADEKYNDLSATLGKGKKAVGYIFYEVPKNAKKITVEYNANFWTDGNTIEFIIQ